MNDKFENSKPNMSIDLAKIIKRIPIVIIKISALWCNSCKNKQFLESYYKLKSLYSNNKEIQFIELDIDDDIDIIDDKKYYNIDITAVPTFLIAKNGYLIRKYEGGGYLNDINEFIYNSLKQIKNVAKWF